MIAIVPQMRVLLAVQPVDFRRGIDGLVAICRERLHAEARFSFLRAENVDLSKFWLTTVRVLSSAKNDFRAAASAGGRRMVRRRFAL